MEVFAKFKSVVKIRQIHIDNNVFELHYRVTAFMLWGCAALVASKQHFGDPIDCITRDDVPNKIMDTYCWIHSTFTLPDACNRTVGIEVAHPCVDKSEGLHNEKERVYQKYYQWVYFVLFFQGIFFYAPHLFWKSYESSLIKTLCAKLQSPLSTGEDDQKEREKVATRVAKYLNDSRKRQQNYYYSFVLFELLNFINVVVQVYVVDAFLGGTFTTYGLDVLNYIQIDQEDRVDPMVRVFPKMTKCTFHRFGASGDVQRYDALCILPLNIINEKIYIIMWFWFLFLTCVTGVWLIYRLMTFLNPSLRLRSLQKRANFTPVRNLRMVLHDAPTGHWFLLNMLCRNMDSQWFKFVIAQLIIQMQQETRKQRDRRGNSAMRGGRSGAGGQSKDAIEQEDDAESSDDEQSHSSDVRLDVGETSKLK